MTIADNPDPANAETLEQVIDEIIGQMDDASRVFVQTSSASPPEFHHSVGRGIRNGYGLWHDSPLAQHFKARFGLGHADDMSSLILIGVFAKLRDQEIEPELWAQEYRAFWRQRNIDPLTLKNLA